MSSELVVLGQENTTPAVVNQGGLGIDFSNPLFQLKPGTININQPNTQVDGAIKGHFRISETGDQYEEMQVALLLMPVEQRSFYIGEAGSMNRSPDNLMCFSRDMLSPDIKAKQPQALRCGNCPKQDWEKWRQDKRKENIPPCDAYYYALMIDTKFKMPLQMYIRSKSKDAFKAGMQNLAREFAKMKSQNLNPNIFDIRFTMKTKKITTGSFQSYILDLSAFKGITEDEREQFGEIYQQFAKRNRPVDEVADYVEDQVAAANESIDAAALGSDQEIPI